MKENCHAHVHHHHFSRHCLSLVLGLDIFSAWTGLLILILQIAATVGLHNIPALREKESIEKLVNDRVDCIGDLFSGFRVTNRIRMALRYFLTLTVASPCAQFESGRRQHAGPYIHNAGPFFLA